MICADCKRTLTKAALQIGRYSFGPRCAKRYIIAPTRTLSPQRLPHAAVYVDPAQMALFEEQTC